MAKGKPRYRAVLIRRGRHRRGARPGVHQDARDRSGGLRRHRRPQGQALRRQSRHCQGVRRLPADVGPRKSRPGQRLHLAPPACGDDHRRGGPPAQSHPLREADGHLHRRGRGDNDRLPAQWGETRHRLPAAFPAGLGQGQGAGAGGRGGAPRAGDAHPAHRPAQRRQPRFRLHALPAGGPGGGMGLCPGGAQDRPLRAQRALRGLRRRAPAF